MLTDTGFLPGESLPIWPGEAPGSRIEEMGLPRIIDAKSGNLHGIREPRITPYLPAQPNGTAAIVVPGGAYSQLVMEKEGVEPARWLNTLGITAFVLEYRLPVEPHDNPHLVALQDLQRAIRLVRAHSREYGIDPRRIGVLGLSSGGHLAACAGTAFERQTYPHINAVDAESARPDFMVLAYGPYTGNMHYSHASREQLFFPSPVKNALYQEFPVNAQVTAKAPPAFLVTADNDNRVSPENSSELFLALHRAGVNAQLHIYDDGGHGFALRAEATTSIAGWTKACHDWLRNQGLLPREPFAGRQQEAVTSAE